MKLLVTLAIFSLLVACGGAPPDVADPTDPADVDGDPTAIGNDAPTDGIKRDADGDGQMDQSGGDCAAMDETKCKISAGCAWTDEGKCAEGSLSPM